MSFKLCSDVGVSVTREIGRLVKVSLFDILGDPEILKAILHGDEKPFYTSKELDDCLIAASKANLLESVTLLVRAKADVNAHHTLMCTNYDVLDNILDPLCNSITNGNEAMTLFLLQHGADVCFNRNLPLRLAIVNDHATIVHHLIENKANVNEPTADCLYLASCVGNPDIVKTLIDAKADATSTKSIAMREAAKRGFTSCVKILLDAGADATALNNWALRDSSELGFKEIADLLRARGATLEADT